MKPPTVKVKLEGLRFPHPLYRVSQIVGAVTIRVLNKDYRVNDSFDETVAKELASQRGYSVTVSPAKHK